MVTPYSFSLTLTPDDAEKLKQYCQDRGFPFSEPPQYARWKAEGTGFKIIYYASGKAVVQGKGADEFVRYTVEALCPLHAGTADRAASALQPPQPPEHFAPHAGLDESGKGDFFGPLVICCAYVDERTVASLTAAGVRDCKLVNDAQLFNMAATIKSILTPSGFSVVVIGNEAYNRLYAKFSNLNRLLAWGHARALENILEKVPGCPAALADQFGNPELIKRALLEKAQKIQLIQRHKAESDIAVAAASVLARAEFLNRLARLADTAGVKLPKGAGSGVLETGKKLWEQTHNTALFEKISKLHFSTFLRIRGLPVPEK